MKQLLDFDPVTGLAYYTEERDDGKITLHTEQDCRRILEHTKEKRNSGSGDNKIAGHMSHYAEIPNGVALALMKKGINVYKGFGRRNTAEWNRFAREIETNYPYLKVTDKRAWRPK